MQIIYYDKYAQKREHKRYANLKEELSKIEQKISKINSTDEMTFYQGVSNHKKILRFADGKGGYRLAVFFYEDCCLMVDFESKQSLEQDGVTSEILFEDKDNEYFIDFILKNKKEEVIENIDLNDYKSLLELNESEKYGEIAFESKNFSKRMEKSKDSLKDIFYKIQNILFDEKEEAYHNYNTIYKIDDKLFYKKLYDEDINITFFMEESDDLKEIDKITSKEELQKKAVKSYPLDIFLEDSEEWIEYIVKNSDGNIALSPEEEDILIELKSFANTNKFPFFINGRAGSGKSTILQYLFADYVVEFLKLSQTQKELEYEPLYLTYNDRLKDKAIDRVVNIILAKTKKEDKEKLNLKTKNTIQRQIEGYFKSFDTKEGYNFLEELLYLNNKENRLKNFTKISFEEIKNYFTDLIKKKGKKYKNYTPELIWYVIRSYIKGRGIIKDDKLQPLTPDQYKSLNKSLKTIKEEVFNVIYNDFYQTYQRYLKEHNFYDDLDLVFEIYKQQAFNKKYSVIFCDEAQDFTKVEFDMILNLNIFLDDNIKLDNFNASNIPIVFAGDPFQTINPTGFSFEYLKALVYESYDKKGFPTHLNYKELKFNYRSNDEIIKFSNLIQTLRGVIFEDKTIQLQTRWLDNIPNSYSILFFDEKIENDTSYQFIFPTNKKADYENDELFQYFDVSDVVSPIDIKGLEYPIIVLYKFGDFYVKNYENIMKFIENGFKDKESSLPYEYFFNNFYVAITRAKEKIIIIDTKEAKEEFWDKIEIEKLFTKLKEWGVNISKDELLTFKEGTKEDLKLDETEQLLYTLDKLKTDIFDRYDSEKNKTLILNEIEKILKLKQLNEVYEYILNGFKAENNENYLKAVKNLMKAAKKASKNGELAKSQIVYLQKKSFDNLLNSIELEDDNTLKFLEKYKDDFISLGIRFEKKVKLLEYFLNKNYIKTLDYILDEFDIRDKNKILDFIIKKSLESIDDYELSEYLQEFYKRDFISKEDIISFVKKRLDNKNYKSLIKVFDEELKKQYRDLYCEINLEINSDDIDCLIHKNKLDKVIELMKTSDVNIDEYYKQIVYYISKNNLVEMFDYLDLDLLVETYIKFYDELNINVWEYILSKKFENEDLENISVLMKFFENKPTRVQIEHLKVLTKLIANREKPLINKLIFNTLITLFSSISNYPICEIIVSLEKTMSFYEEENVRKILNYYNYYIRDRKHNKYKYLVGSRYIKLRYELSNEKEHYENNTQWLEAVKRKVKFLKVQAEERIIRNIPIRMNLALCERVKNLKSVDEIYKRIIEIFEEENKPAPIPEPTPPIEPKEPKEIKTTEPKVMEISKENIEDIILDIQEFIENNKDSFSKRDIAKIFNASVGLVEDLKELKG